MSAISFAIIELPPGDYVTAQVAMLKETGEEVNEERIAALRKRYNLDRGPVARYVHWLGGLARGDLGRSMEWDRPVTQILGERILLTMAISILTLLVTWGVAIPIGIYSAVRKYSIGDYAFTFIGFIGLATPPFLLALIFMYVGYSLFGVSAGGLFSPAFENAPWSLARVADLLAHIWVPVVIVGMAGTAGLIRIMRGNLLDELGKQYVVTARAKGVHPLTVLLKYPVRVALNPLVSTLGWLLPAIVSGATITSLVLGLPTTGPVLLRALRNQDMYLAGSIVMLLSTLTVVGTLLSDLLLMWLDPRVRYESRAR
jgi:peptide/nickel transport system permease protein